MSAFPDSDQIAFIRKSSLWARKRLLRCGKAASLAGGIVLIFLLLARGEHHVQLWWAKGIPGQVCHRSVAITFPEAMVS
jgi:hypothetical protein